MKIRIAERPWSDTMKWMLVSELTRFEKPPNQNHQLFSSYIIGNPCLNQWIQYYIIKILMWKQFCPQKSLRRATLHFQSHPQNNISTIIYRKIVGSEEMKLFQKWNYIYVWCFLKGHISQLSIRSFWTDLQDSTTIIYAKISGCNINYRFHVSFSMNDDD